MKEKIPFGGSYRKFEVLEVMNAYGVITDVQCKNLTVEKILRKEHGLNPNRGDSKRWVK